MNPHFASSKHIFQTPPFSDHTKSILRYIPNMLLLYLLVNTRVVQKRARFPSTLRESQSSPKNTQNVNSSRLSFNYVHSTPVPGSALVQLNTIGLI
jgi:hypothetical protein